MSGLDNSLRSVNMDTFEISPEAENNLAFVAPPPPGVNELVCSSEEETAGSKDEPLQAVNAIEQKSQKAASSAFGGGERDSTASEWRSWSCSR